jgi:hypothetical protein
MFRTTRFVAIGALMLLFGSLPAMAQTFNVVARVGLGRPNCDGWNETVVELTNFDPDYWYKVKIEGLSRVAPPGPNSCGNPQVTCETDLLHEVDLPPYSPNTACYYKQYQMPSHSVCPGCVSNCDNRSSVCTEPDPDLPVTCGVTTGEFREWCMELVDLRVTILKRSLDGGVNQPWKNVNIVIASKGQFGSSPTFFEHSYCTDTDPGPGVTHGPLFIGCNPPPSPPGPPLDE